MAATIFFGFLFGFVGSIPVAGPIAVLVFARSAAGRFRDGLLIASGASIGEGLYAAFAYWGLSELLSRYPFIVPVSKGFATLLLVALGIYLALGRSSGEATPSKRAAGGSFLLGFTICVLNPTLLATWAAALTVLVDDAGWMTFHPPYAPLFGFACMVGIVAWFGLVIALFRRYRERFREETLQKVVRVMGGALVALGLYMGYEFVSYLLS